MDWKIFFKAMAVRAVKTVCQTAIATIGTSAAVISDVNWQLVLSASLLAGLLSVLTSIMTGLPEVTYVESAYMDVEEPIDSVVVEEETVEEGDEHGED